MWEMDSTERLVRQVMYAAVLVTFVVLMFMDLNMKPEQLRPVFAPAAPTPAVVSRP